VSNGASPRRGGKDERSRRGPGGRGRKGGERRPKRPRRARETSAALGARIVRHSSVHLGGLFAVQLISFASFVVVAHYLGPADFGRFGLLLFFAALITLLFKIATKRGTYMQVFGGDDEDDDEDDEDGAAAEERDRILGNGIALSGLLVAVLALVLWPLSGPVSDLLLEDGGDSILVFWAGLAGGFEGVWTLTSNVVRLERRPVAFVFLSAVRPILILIGVVAFVIAGAGLEGAILGLLLGTAASVVAALVAIRRSYERDFDPAVARSIIGRGYVRVPIIVSYWTVAHADKFIVSRFVSPTDLGIYQFAAMTGLLLSAVPAAFFKAWRPLKRTMTFAAVDDQYGVGVARGAMLSYFGLVCITALLGIALFAPVLVRLAPPSFEDAAPLIPLLAAGAVMPYVLRGMNKAGTLGNKRRNYILAVVSGAVMFVALALILIPLIGLEGSPLAMMIAFAISSLFLFWLSQRGKKPLKLEYRSLAGATLLAIAAGIAYYLVDPESLAAQFGLATALFLAYAGAGVAAGVVPRPHRRALIEMGRTTVRRPSRPLDPERAIRELSAEERLTLRMAIADRRPADEIGQALGGNGEAGGERVVRALRRVAARRAPAAAQPTEHDARIGEYLLSTSSVASRDATAQRLLSEGVASADLHTLEDTLEALGRAPREAWSEDGR
jgi:O-antigen/teichoic acid export membrane protein